MFGFTSTRNPCGKDLLGDIVMKEAPKKEKKAPQGDLDQSREASEDDYVCPICFDLIVRPVVLNCGQTVCELCLTLLLHYAYTETGQCESICPVLGNDCPACGPVTFVPHVAWLLHKHIQRAFPEKYAERLVEVKPKEFFVENFRVSTVMDEDGNQAEDRWLGAHLRGIEGEGFDVRLRLTGAMLFWRYVVPLLCTLIVMQYSDRNISLGGLGLNPMTLSWCAYPLEYSSLLLTDIFSATLGPPFKAHVPRHIIDALSSYRPHIIESHLWPAGRLNFASSLETGRFGVTWYIVCFCLSSLYINVYISYLRVKYRLDCGDTIPRVIRKEIRDWLCVILLVELVNFIDYASYLVLSTNPIVLWAVEGFVKNPSTTEFINWLFVGWFRYKTMAVYLITWFLGAEVPNTDAVAPSIWSLMSGIVNENFRDNPEEMVGRLVWAQSAVFLRYSLIGYFMTMVFCGL